MSEVKKVFLVSLIVSSDKDGIRSVSQSIAYTEFDARNAVKSFGERHDPECKMYEWSQCVTGTLPKGDGEDVLRYHGVYKQVEIQPELLEDAYKAYEVEVEVTRKWTMTVTIDEGDSEMDAEDKAMIRIQNGDEDWRMDCPDDEDVDVLSICEG